MTLAPQLNTPTLCQAALLMMASAPARSNFPPVARGAAVMGSGALSAACAKEGSRGLSVIKVQHLELLLIDCKVFRGTNMSVVSKPHKVHEPNGKLAAVGR